MHGKGRTQRPRKCPFDHAWAGESVLRAHAPFISGHPFLAATFFFFFFLLCVQEGRKRANQLKAKFIFWDFPIYLYMFCLLLARPSSSVWITVMCNTLGHSLTASNHTAILSGDHPTHPKYPGPHIDLGSMSKKMTETPTFNSLKAETE